MISLHPTAKRRNPRPLSPFASERARIRALPAVRLLAGRFGLPLATAILIAESCGLYTGGDRR
jgi:hypothetical protein